MHRRGVIDGQSTAWFLRQSFAIRHGILWDGMDSGGIRSDSKYARELQSVDDKQVSLS